MSGQLARDDAASERVRPIEPDGAGPIGPGAVTPGEPGAVLRAKRAAAILAVDTPVIEQGITFVSGDEAGCVMQMTVQRRQCNSHGICHGGITMMFADTAAAYALNTGEQSPRWVTSHSSSSLLAPGRTGEQLTATAVIGSGSERSRIVDVRVTEPDGTAVVEMRNVMVRLRG